FQSIPAGPGIVGVPWTYQAIATDPDAGDVLTYRIDADSIARGVTINSDTGTIRWTPGASGDFETTVTADDGNGGTADLSYALTVIKNNAAPEFTSEPTGPAIVGQPWAFTATASDPDDPEDSLVITLVDVADDSGVVLATGTDTTALQNLGISFDADTNTLAWTAAAPVTYTFTLRVTDPDGGAQDLNFTLPAVTDNGSENSPPVFRSIASTTPVEVGGVYSYDADAFDPDGDTLTYALVSSPVGASIDPATGLLTWTPQATGTFDLLISVEDTINSAVTQPVRVSVVPPVTTNEPPEITSEPGGVPVRDVAFEYQATATDPNGDVITWSLNLVDVPAAANSHATNPLSIDPVTGLLTWTPTAGGNFIVDVIASDPGGATDGQRITIPVAGNALPRFTSDPVVEADIAVDYVYTAVASDPNTGDTLVYSLDQTSLDRGMTINASTGAIAWPAASYPAGIGASAAFAITVTVSDGAGGSDTQSYDLTIKDPLVANAPPVIDGTWDGSVLLDSLASYQVNATDPDGDTIVYSLTQAPAGMTISSTGLISWTPTGDVLGVHPITVNVTDGQPGHDVTAAMQVTVTSVANNTPPQFITQPPRYAVANQPLVYLAQATDADGDTIVYSGDENNPSGVDVFPDTGRVQWLPRTADIGTHTLTIYAADPAGGVMAQIFDVEVLATNRPPTIDSDPVTFAITNTPYNYAVRATDPDGHTIEFSLGAATTADGDIAVDPQTGLVTWKPAAIGTYVIEVVAADELGLATGHRYEVTVADTLPNDPPRITNAPPLEIEAGQIYTYDAEAIDPNGDKLLFSLANGPAGATIDPTEGVVSWSAPIGAVGNLVDFKVVVSDGRLTGTREFNIRVQPQNESPIVTPIDPVDLIAGQTLRVDVVAHDANPEDTLTYSLDEASKTLGIEIDAVGRITWNTDALDVTAMPHDVIVSASDGRLIGTTTFAVTVSADNDAPEVAIVVMPPQADDGRPDNVSGFSIGDNIDLRVHAVDNVEAASRKLELVSVTDINGQVTLLNQSLPLSPLHLARLAALPQHLGFLTFEATATDAAGNVGTTTVQVQVIDPTDNQAPQVDLLPPSGEVITPTELLGTVLDDTPNVAWTLAVTPVDTNDLGDWTRIIAQGNGLVTSAAALGTFDPTMLENGSYRVTLSATDAGSNTAWDSVVIDVDGRLKLGNFSLSFTDLQIPVAGIPITITRTYDTLRADNRGDFGFGWNLEIARPEMSVDFSTTGAANFGGYATFVDDTRITITTPEGTEEGFTFKWIPVASGLEGVGQTDAFGPSFTPDDGNRYQLTPPNRDNPLTPGMAYTFKQVSDGGSYQVNGGTRHYSPLDPFFGGAFELKEVGPGTRGLSYLIDVRN
ncbi:MAG: putative Ig domain-containing protein, partial [Pirellulales bacterium]|nr:putative Ig domain-containing protein [Pirellulales bacterium]